VCGDVFALKDCPKLNDKRFPMAAKILHAQKMCPRCSSNYHLVFISMFDTTIALKIFKEKKGSKKSSAAKPNQETCLAQVTQKMMKRTTMLIGKVASNKIVTVRTKHCLIGNIKENRDRELERVSDFSKSSRTLSSTYISSSDSSSDSSKGVSVSVEIIPPR